MSGLRIHNSDFTLLFLMGCRSITHIRDRYAGLSCSADKMVMVPEALGYLEKRKRLSSASATSELLVQKVCKCKKHVNFFPCPGGPPPLTDLCLLHFSRISYRRVISFR
jgi:hypothetical protein